MEDRRHRSGTAGVVPPSPPREGAAPAPANRGDLSAPAAGRDARRPPTVDDHATTVIIAGPGAAVDPSRGSPPGQDPRVSDLHTRRPTGSHPRTTSAGRCLGHDLWNTLAGAAAPRSTRHRKRRFSWNRDRPSPAGRWMRSCWWERLAPATSVASLGVSRSPGRRIGARAGATWSLVGGSRQNSLPSGSASTVQLTCALWPTSTRRAPRPSSRASWSALVPPPAGTRRRPRPRRRRRRWPGWRRGSALTRTAAGLDPYTWRA